ncbi:hypothetical protein C8R44DRAFT_882344 [Mycena epipterygia]|nr:hypothetical protein C8R44DRAFT_882344 [Mycena epipterygia]
MLTPSAIIALTLITASAPAFSAPVPAARELPTTYACLPYSDVVLKNINHVHSNGVAARSIASLLEGFLGQGIEGLVGDFLGGASSGTASTDTDPTTVSARQFGPIEGLSDVIGTVGGGIEFILSKLFSRPFTDLSDSEVNQLLEYINGVDKREFELNARFSIPLGLLTSLKTLGKGVLSGAAIGGLETLLGGAGDSDSTTTTTDTTDPAAPPSATDAPAASLQAFANLSDSEVKQLLEYINGMGSKAARSASLNELD